MFIPGFDELIEGGIPKGFNVLVAGSPGTGKSILGIQYIYNGAVNNEKGIYVSLESSADMIREQGKQFGYDIEKMEKEGKMAILRIPMDKPKINIFDMLEKAVETTKATRLVFDSLASFAINIDQFIIPLEYIPDWIFLNATAEKENLEDNVYRSEIMPIIGKDPKNRMIYKGNDEKRITYLIINELSKLGTTNLIITATKLENEKSETMDGVSEYVCDGLVDLRALAVGNELSRTLEIKKMRNTNTDGGIKSYNITSKGIELLKE
jgi:circadian clock protein KaiC